MPGDPLVGQTLAGTYLVVERLAAGGMGTLYKARHLGLQQTVALKFIHPHLLTDARALRRLPIEARALAAFSHPNIVAIKAVSFSDCSSCFIVMEYLEGQDLGQFLQAHGVLDGKQFKQIFEPICRALQTAHEKKIVHRDLKPSNIMLVSDEHGGWVPKLLDFGLAKFTDTGASQKLTSSGALMGSFAYISPEQCAGEPIDQRIDVYSLACVMHEALTGEAFFASGQPMTAVYRHCNESLPPLPDPLDSALSSVLQRASAVDPTHRFNSMDQLWSAIAGGATVVVPESPNKPKKKSLLLALIVTAACVLAGFGAYLSMPGLNPDETMVEDLARVRKRALAGDQAAIGQYFARVMQDSRQEQDEQALGLFILLADGAKTADERQPYIDKVVIFADRISKRERVSVATYASFAYVTASHLMAWGDLVRAQRIIDEEMEYTTHRKLKADMARMYVVQSRLDKLGKRPQDATRHLKEASRLAFEAVAANREHTNLQALSFAQQGLAEDYSSHGDGAGARAALDSASELLSHPPTSWTDSVGFNLVSARLAARFGERERAVKLYSLVANALGRDDLNDVQADTLAAYRAEARAGLKALDRQ